jgi:hypothetical protein
MQLNDFLHAHSFQSSSIVLDLVHVMSIHSPQLQTALCCSIMVWKAGSLFWDDPGAASLKVDPASCVKICKISICWVHRIV